MSFLTPLFLLLSALAVPIIILYMLKLRRREVEISSVMLWQMLLRDREANAPWQKLKRNLLLLLQLLLLALLVLSLARPFLSVPTVARGTLIVLLDASASMNAGDVPPTRFDAAKAAIRELVNGLASDSRMSLILVGRQPSVLASATGDKETLRAALSTANVTQGVADWEAAFALAGGAARAGLLSETRIVVFSDGGLPSGLPPLPGDVRYVPIGTSAENVAIEALSLRPAGGGPQLFARVANYGESDRAVIVSINLGERLYSAQQLTVPAGGAEELILPDLPDEPAVYSAKLSAPGAEEGAAFDALALDDTAWAVYQPPTSGRVLVLSPGNVFLEQMLTALPGLQPFRASPTAPLPEDPFDLYVYDSVTTTAKLPSAELLFVNPISDTAIFQVGGIFTNTKLARVAANDPLTQFLDWSKVNILQARRVAVPDWARVLVSAEGGPLVLAGETGGRRVAILTFRLQDSDLPLQLAYPVLMSNLINYLAPAQAFSAPDGLQPGETLLIKPRGGDTAIGIDDPDGERFAAQTTEAGVLFTASNKLGVYTVVSNQTVLGNFAVNLFNAAESNIRPAATISVGRAEVTATPREEVGQLEIWPWLALAAFALLLLEWWIYHRGPTLPAAPGVLGWFRRKKSVV